MSNAPNLPSQDLFDRLMRAQNAILTAATEGLLVSVDPRVDRDYRDARQILLSERALQTLIPAQIRDCRTAEHFYRRIEAETPSNSDIDKRQKIWEMFVPLFDKAEFQVESAAKSPITAQPVAVPRAAQLQTAPSQPGNIFIGHGHSLLWRALKDFIAEDLGLQWDEFNREPTPGISTSERLKTMLQKAAFALLVMTGEDERSGGTLHARDNVIHEIGLFQGRLGFERAIVLLEDGCARFSNIDGLTYIGFPKDRIEASFEAIRKVLRREGLIK